MSIVSKSSKMVRINKMSRIIMISRTSEQGVGQLFLFWKEFSVKKDDNTDGDKDIGKIEGGEGVAKKG